MHIIIKKKGKKCVFHADVYPETAEGVLLTANEITFREVELYSQQDVGEKWFSLPVDQAKKLAEDILLALKETDNARN